jgi:tetratricopeptide (TPR) repeat protein
MAIAEAVKHLAHGIELLPVLDEPLRTDIEIELQAAIGPAYMATVGWAAPEVETSSVRLHELALARKDYARVYQAKWSRWTYRFLRGLLVQALEIAGEAFDAAQASGDPVLLVTGHHALGYTHFYRGEYDQALKLAKVGLELFDLESEKWIATNFQFSSSCALLCYLAQAQQILGFAEEAAETLRRWRELVDALRHAPSRAYSLVQQCHFFYAQGNAEEVCTLATEGRALAVSEGFVLWPPIMDIFLAWSSARRGGDASFEAERIRQAKAIVDRSDTHITEIDFSSMFAEVLLLGNQPQKALEVAEAALAITRPGAVKHLEAELLRLQGEAALALGDTRRAAAFYRSALDSARATGAVVLERRVSAALERCVNVA